MDKAIVSSGEPVRLSVSNWKAYPGCLYGLTTPAIEARISVDIPDTIAFDLIDAAFEQQFKGTLEDLADTPMTTQAALIRRVLQWSAIIQRVKKIPVSREHRFPKTLVTGQPVPVCLSYIHIPATRHVVTHLCQTLPSLLAASTSEAQLGDMLNTLDANLSQVLEPFAERGQNRAFLAQYARDAGIPINAAHPFHPIFGTGRYATRLESTLTHADPMIGVRLARSKRDTGYILRKAGFPGAENIRVNSWEEAKSAANRLGYPVVVKPEDKERGEGVYADLRSEKSLHWAYHKTKDISSKILIEKHFEGRGHRITLCGNVLLTATRKTSAGVTGDGKNTVRSLIDIEQAQRDKDMDEQSAYRAPLTLDEEAMTLLDDYGVTPDTVLSEGVFLPLRRKNNASAGGESEIIKDENSIHPDNISLCQDAAACLGLNLVGVDLFMPDISVSWKDTGALICEVNAVPQIGYEATARLMETLFPEKGCVPTYCLLVPDGGTFCRDTYHALATSLKCDVVSDIDGLKIAGRRRPRTFTSYFDAAKAALFHTKGSSILFVLPVTEAITTGLPVGRLDGLYFDPTAWAGATKDLRVRFLKAVENNCAQITALPLSA